jgi:hypothetical protein
LEDEFVVRGKKILSILEREMENGEAMAAAVNRIAEGMLLGEKGYAPTDVRKDVVFNVELGDETATSFVDFLVSVDNKPAMVVKCASGSLSSRERHVVAAARLIGDMPLPVAVVMDPMSALVLDGVTGKIIGEGFESIPTKAQLTAMLSGREVKPLPREKMEREKRVLLAFDAIRCCIPQGGEGGVNLDDIPGDQSCS